MDPAKASSTPPDSEGIFLSKYQRQYSRIRTPMIDTIRPSTHWSSPMLSVIETPNAGIHSKCSTQLPPDRIRPDSLNRNAAVNAGGIASRKNARDLRYLLNNGVNAAKTA